MGREDGGDPIENLPSTRRIHPPFTVVVRGKRQTEGERVDRRRGKS